jgi:hypothetical protein
MAQDQTRTFTADNIGNPEPVTIQGEGTRTVKIWENAKANTTSFIVREPNMTSPGVTISVGGDYIFRKPGRGPYGCGDIAGYVETVDAASAIFAQKEGPHDL